MASRRLLRPLLTAALLWTQGIAPAAAAGCGTFVMAQSGDTCASLAALAGISVGQFLRNNPNLTSCDRLSTGENYCVEQGSTSSSSARSTPSPVPGGLEITTDGHCGEGWTCAGSEFGDCCSEHGWCGSSAEHCGPKCQKPFGICAGSGSESSVSQPPSSSSVPAGATKIITVTVTTTILATATVPTTRTVSATVTLPASVTTRTVEGAPTTRIVSTTFTTTVAGVGATRTVTTNLYSEVYRTITVISAIRTTETETATTTITSNIFRTITIVSTETVATTATVIVPRTTTVTSVSLSVRTEVVPTTVYRTQTLYATVTATATLPARTTTVTNYDIVTRVDTVTKLETRIVTSSVIRTVTSSVNVAVPVTQTRTVGGGTVTVTNIRTVTLLEQGGQRTVTVTRSVQGGGGGVITVHNTVTVFRTVTAPGSFLVGPGGGGAVTVTRTVTQCDGIWEIIG